MSASLREHIILDMTTNSMYLCCFIGALCAERSPGENYQKCYLFRHREYSQALVIQLVCHRFELSSVLLFIHVTSTQVFYLIRKIDTRVVMCYHVGVWYLIIFL